MCSSPTKVLQSTKARRPASCEKTCSLTMARITRVALLSEVREDLDGIFDHLAQQDADDVSARTREITQALDVLERNLLIGRSVTAENRELVIGRQSHGYVALYHYAKKTDTIFVLALCNQRQAGYTRM